ncbi:hypothetical protein [Cellulomonas sp. Marseille-Q8402]
MTRLARGSGSSAPRRRPPIGARGGAGAPTGRGGRRVHRRRVGEREVLAQPLPQVVGLVGPHDPGLVLRRGHDGHRHGAERGGLDVAQREGEPGEVADVGEALADRQRAGDAGQHGHQGAGVGEQVGVLHARGQRVDELLLPLDPGQVGPQLQPVAGAGAGAQEREGGGAVEGLRPGGDVQAGLG